MQRSLQRLKSNVETLSMIRNLGWALVFVVLGGLATTGQAQTTPYDSGAEFRLNQSYGGFGLQYAQPVVNGGVVMDQYGMWHDVPYVPYVQPAAPVAPARPVVAARTSRSTRRVAVGQPRFQLTTGSLGTTGSNGGILYTPGMRYEAYGNGYGRGPYGVSDYSHMWKGWATD
jgi:hypothetical protein